MKNSTIAIIIASIILISGLCGYLARAYFEKPKVIYKDSPPVIKIDSTDLSKNKAAIAKLRRANDSLKFITKYPKVVFVDSHDSTIALSTGKNIDSLALVNCSNDFLSVLTVYGKCDSLNDALSKKNGRLYKDLDTCNNRYSEAVNDKNNAISETQKEQKNKKWWQGAAISVAILAIIKLLIK